MIICFSLPEILVFKWQFFNGLLLTIKFLERQKALFGGAALKHQSVMHPVLHSTPSSEFPFSRTRMVYIIMGFLSWFLLSWLLLLWFILLFFSHPTAPIRSYHTLNIYPPKSTFCSPTCMDSPPGHNGSLRSGIDPSGWILIGIPLWTRSALIPGILQSCKLAEDCKSTACWLPVSQG